ncbi:DUF1810 domain-containing protein [Candidatus Thioglobus sp.]|uniref:DUF1810 domain-containing protein n=1 Tax=Candidatus Thioglobus sp. TaxID=2026721 RepID=UPI003D11644B
MIDLQRFIMAQNEIYPAFVEEIKQGKKITHWMWFVFPQIAGLGNSEINKRYSIKSLDEASAYLEDDLLMRRMFEYLTILLDIKEKSALDIFGKTDSLKLKSSMTLFATISDELIFEKVLNKYFTNKCMNTTNIIQKLINKQS